MVSEAKAELFHLFYEAMEKNSCNLITSEENARLANQVLYRCLRDLNDTLDAPDAPLPELFSS